MTNKITFPDIDIRTSAERVRNAVFDAPEYVVVDDDGKIGQKEIAEYLSGWGKVAGLLTEWAWANGKSNMADGVIMAIEQLERAIHNLHGDVIFRADEPQEVRDKWPQPRWHKRKPHGRDYFLYSEEEEASSDD